MAATFYHALQVIPDKCRGHLACMRCCPTQAIRIRGGRPVISEELCIDCGTCINACPSGAIVPVSNFNTDFASHQYKVLEPSPALYAQFEAGVHPYIIHQACKQLGFDDVVDVTTSSTILARVLVEYVEQYRGRRPLISSGCPAVMRQIQVRYPDLVELVVPIDVAREITAREIRETYPAKLGLKPEEIAIIYAAPCPATMVSIKQPAEKEKSWLDGAISIGDLYSALLPHVIDLKQSFDPEQVPKDFSFHAGWATLGMVAREGDLENWLAVSGLDHVGRIFDDIENSRLRNVDFVEAQACMLGCIGGPYNVENPYVARTNNIRQRIKYERYASIDEHLLTQKLKQGYYLLERPLLPRHTSYFDTDLATSIKRMKERDRVFQKLPQNDCGCCGSPTCLTFAEDFVRGENDLADCILLAHQTNMNRVKSHSPLTPPEDSA